MLTPAEQPSSRTAKLSAGEHLGYAAHELLGTVTGIAAERYRRVIKGVIKVVRKTLCGLAYGIDIQTVGSESELATQSAGSESQLSEKGICDFSFRQNPQVFATVTALNPMLILI